MKTQYYAYYPRNFRNQYRIIRVTTPDELEQLNAWFDGLSTASDIPSLERVTMDEIRAMQTAERERRINSPAFGGYCNPFQPISVSALAGAGGNV